MIVTSGPTATRPAQQATSTIPIVMSFDDDPVGSGFVASFSRPGGNITGLSTLAPEISGKRLELLKETLRSLARVTVAGTANRQGVAQVMKEMEVAARPRTSMSGCVLAQKTPSEFLKRCGLSRSRRQ